MNTFLRTARSILGHGIFWLWNLIFLLLTYGFILPTQGMSLPRAVFAGEVQAELLFSLVGIILLPSICTGLGIWLRRSDRLLKLFFGVEAPVMILLSLRLGVLRELTDASYFLFGLFGLSLVAFAISIRWPNWGEPHSGVTILKGLLCSVILLMGLYVGVFTLIYVTPLFGLVLRSLGEGSWLVGFPSIWSNGWYYALETLLFLALFVLSLLFMIALPVVFFGLYSQAGLQGYQQLAQRYGRAFASVSMAATIMASCVVLGGFNRQPQVAAFDQIEQTNTLAERQEIVANAAQIRHGLLNAYLKNYRYFGTHDESQMVKELYHSAFGNRAAVNPVTESARDRFQPIQDLHDALIAPFLYQGDRAEQAEAAELYAEIFDTPIQKGEKQAIRKALTSTTMLDAANAGVMNIDEQKVWIARQELTVETHTNYLDVELYEVYQNQTNDVEEIFYGFTLPENAVLTGVWLNETRDRATRYPFQIAPRGAAQKVYNSQVQRERPRDPALLEQVGPNQYRLRAFPIPTRLQSWEELNSRPTEMHLWLTYRVIPEPGISPLPTLNEVRNVYWTEQTERMRNGERVAGFDTWLEPELDNITRQPPKTLPPVAIAGYEFTARPINSQAPDWRGAHWAVLLDASYSMAAQQEQLQAQLDWLVAEGLLDGDRANGEVELYRCDAAQTQAKRVTGTTVAELVPLFYGVVQWQDMIRGGAKLTAQGDYDGLIVLSDAGSYELAAKVEQLPQPSVPLWLVHLDHLPLAYDDATFKAVQDSQGGVTQDLATALERWAQQTALEENSAIAGQWRWQRQPNPAAVLTTTGLEPIAARHLITQLAREVDANDPTTLDPLHRLATDAAIVTPYSSMIVLVNDEQRQALREAEATGERYARVVEDGNEQLQQPNGVLGTTAIPEPGFWLGALLTMGFIGLKRRSRRLCGAQGGKSSVMSNE